MKNKAFLTGVLAAIVFSTMALGFDARFADSQGNQLLTIWEGEQFWVVVDDRELGQCPPGEFYADLVIFDFKTGAYIEEENARFLEIPNESGIYFWVDAGGQKVWVEVGDRKDWVDITEMEHELGDTALGDIWQDGNWMYVDEDVADPDGDGIYDIDYLPQHRETARIQFDEYPGRFENMDTLVLIVAARHDERLIDQDQLKIIDTVSSITVEPATLEHGCGVMCNVRVTIVDADENLDCNEIDYVPFFLIVNPGSWVPDSCAGILPPPEEQPPEEGPPPPPSSVNPMQPPPPPGEQPPVPPAEECLPITTFCALVAYGGVDEHARAYAQPIRWYNIYDAPTQAHGLVASRYIDYPDDWLVDGNTIAPVMFYAWETGEDTGVFVYDFGLLEDLEALLGFDRFEAGTTLAFYYLDPNDFDDFSLTTAEVYDRPHSETFFTDAGGVPVDEVRLGTHHGLYVRVYDDDANIDACCQDKVVVHLCDPHGEDDSEYWMLDEVSNDSGIFASQSGMPLLPVWDAVGGYQLVVDSWTFEAFNEDTIYVRYNSVGYHPEALHALGNGDPNELIDIDLNHDGDTADPGETNLRSFAPRVDPELRDQVWDVSFDTVKVYDFQVFDGTTHHMQFLDGTYSPVDEIRVGGNLYLEITDLDQNENPNLRELIFGGWNMDADAADQDEHSDPIWWLAVGDSDRMTPDGALVHVELADHSITGIPETVKIFMWNAQRGTWERMDMRETAVGSGIFRSTTCVLVADARDPGDGNLASEPGDTIFAFYQDPSNHSDISIIQIKVSEGGAEAVTPPVAPQVAFDAPSYLPGDLVTITVTDPAYGDIIEGTDVLVVTDASGAEIFSADTLTGTTGVFQVSFQLPEEVAIGTMTAVYTDPTFPTRQAQATAQVRAAELEDVYGVIPVPQVFSVSTTFTLDAEPAGAVADKFEITIYDLLGRKVAELSDTDTAELIWDGGNLRNGAYIYVAVVTYDGTVEVFRGFVYIKR